MENTVTQTLSTFSAYFSKQRVVDFIFLFLTIVIILLVFRIFRTIVLRLIGKKINDSVRNIIKKVFDYLGIIVVIMTIFKKAGIDFSAIIGAAGIVGIAAGFAAQTSISNIISGFFVMTDGAFHIGDFIKIDSISGTVQSVSLLSVRLKTPDNQLIRIPNETIIKANIINISYFPMRRFDLRFSVSFDTDLRWLNDILLDIVKNNIYALKDPAPVIIFDSFASSTIEVLCGVWGKKENFLLLRNSMMIDLTERMRKEGIIIPVPQMKVELKE